MPKLFGERIRLPQVLASQYRFERLRDRSSSTARQVGASQIRSTDTSYRVSEYLHLAGESGSETNG